MTTTHTFQGLNTDGKPSSRVLNPPGGSSSNIFGGYDDQPPQRTPIRNNPDNVNRSNSDVFGPGHNAAASSQQKSRAPRSGDDSFHTLFGNCHTSGGRDKASSNIRVNSPSTGVLNQRIDNPTRSYSRIHHKSPDTFFSIFGNEVVERRKMFRSILNNNDDSFTRLFGHSNTNLPQETASSTSSVRVSTVKPSCTPIVTSSNSKVSAAMYREDKMGDKGGNLSSLNQVSRNNTAVDKRGLRQRRFYDRGAFNPITGEAYDQPTSKQAPPTSVSRTSENNSIKTDTASSESSDTSRSQSSEQQKPQPVEEEKPVPVEHETPPPTEQETPKPIEQENPKSVEQEQSKPVEQEKVEPTPITVNAQAAQNKKQQEGGHFGGPDDAKEQHRSTRVSQPPGGRSTNLW